MGQVKDFIGYFLEEAKRDELWDLINAILVEDNKEPLKNMDALSEYADPEMIIREERGLCIDATLENGEQVKLVLYFASHAFQVHDPIGIWARAYSGQALNDYEIHLIKKTIVIAIAHGEPLGDEMRRGCFRLSDKDSGAFFPIDDMQIHVVDLDFVDDEQSVRLRKWITFLRG